MPELLEGPRLDGIRLLIVEDDQDSRDMLCELLRRHGAECWTAEDVPSARRKLAEITPDVILSDIGLPGEDGYALLRWVRARVSSMPSPVVMAVSAFDLVDWRAAGFEMHIRKPIDVLRLLRALVDVKGRRASQV